MNYRNAFIVMLVLALALGAGLVHFWDRAQHPPAQSSMPVAAAQPGAAMPPTEAESAAPKLTPVQLSPQRLQSIGVKFAEVTRKPVHDELRVTGNVDVDEERL